MQQPRLDVLFRFLAGIALAVTLACALAGTLASSLVGQVDETLLAGIRARSIGPAGMSGRVVAIDAVIRDPNVIYVGAATGGLWKSTNGGLTFQPIFDDQPVASIGAVTIYQASPDIVWVGTGEGNPRNSVSLGNGVYKSTDGGRTWEHLGLENTERIRRIWVHPSDPDVAFVAALGTAWGENTERGLYQTLDGGKTWQRALYVDARTGCIDIEVDPSNPKKMFAAMWDHRRKPWTFRSGGPGSGLHRSVDGGRTWTKLDADDGLPKGDLGRIKPAFAPSNPQIVYVLAEAKKNQLLRSDDGGFTFRTINQEDNVAPRPFYYCDLRIDPQNPDRIYNLHSSITLSTDGGKTFRQLVGYAQAHPDHHAMWIDPNNPKLLIEGNDGGVSISRDQGKTWDFVTQLPLAQFYHISVDMEQPYNVYGGLQDNGSWRGPNTVWENGGIRNHHWDELCFGDGFAVLADPDDATRGYAMSQEGNLIRWDLTTGKRKNVRPIGLEGTELRFNWNAGIAQDPFSASTVYYGSQFVHKTTDRGETWEIISPDLTTNHPQWQKQEESGGLTLDVTGAENYTTILTIAPSPVSANVMWVGTDDGRVHITRNRASSWESLEENIPDLPRNTWCPHIEASQHNPRTAYAVFDDHRRANLTPYLYKTTDYGRTWRNIAKPNVRGYCLVVEEDPVDENLLFLGTEFGLWFTTDGGANWQQFKHGLPTCSVMALVIHPREHDLVIGTHGRAAYVIDDVWPLRGLTQSDLEQPLSLFPIPPAIQFQTKQTAGSRFPGQGEFRGVVKPRGVSITLVANVPGLKHPDKKLEKLRAETAARLKPAAPPPDASEPPDAAGANAEKPKLPVASADTSDAVATKRDEAIKKTKEAGGKPGKAEFEISDDKGKLVRTFERDVHLGINRIVWDMARDGLDRPSRGSQPTRRRGGRPRGRAVLPGTYTIKVTLAAGDKKYTADGKFDVKPDPRENVPMRSRLAKDALMRTAERLLERTAAVTKRLDAVKKEVDAVASKLARMAAADRPKELDAATKAAKKALAAFEKKIWGRSDQQGIVRRRGFGSEIFRATQLGGPDAPTEAERTNLERADKKVDQLVKECNKLLAGPIAKFNEALAQADLSFAADTSKIK